MLLVVKFFEFKNWTSEKTTTLTNSGENRTRGLPNEKTITYAKTPGTCGRQTKYTWSSCGTDLRRPRERRLERRRRIAGAGGSRKGGQGGAIHSQTGVLAAGVPSSNAVSVGPRRLSRAPRGRAVCSRSSGAARAGDGVHQVTDERAKRNDFLSFLVFARIKLIRDCFF